MKRAIAIACTVTLSGVASAEPVEPAAAPGIPAAAPAAPSPEGEISEDSAVVISVGATAVSYGLLYLGTQMEGGSRARQTLMGIGAAGTLFAPSTGRWYAHSPGLGGLELRLTGLGLGAAAFLEALRECPLFSGSSDCVPSGGAALLVAAAGFYAWGTVDDFVMAPRDARRYNARLRQVVLVPLVRAGSHELGVALAARF